MNPRDPRQTRSISLSHLTVVEVGPPDLIDLAADAGFASTGIRLSPAVRGGNAYPLRAGSPEMKQTLARMNARRIRVLDIEVALIDDDTEVRSFVPTFEAGAELGATRVCVNIDDPDRLRSVDKFAALCDLAAPFGLTLDLEFMVWRPVSTLEIAIEVVRAANRPNGKILVDALHLDRSGGSVAALAAVDPSLLGSAQLCDAPKQRPAASGIVEEARGRRLPPGEGDLPLVALLDSLPATLPLSAEVPMALSMPALTPLERARRVHDATDAFMRRWLARPSR
jgi:sugar phosphate isomerase/epimerase